MTDDELEQFYKDKQKTASQYARIPLVLNGYQLANLLRALRLTEQSGDWYYEILGQIDYQLRASDLCLDEYYNPDTEQKYVRPFNNGPNLPYPENIPNMNGKKPSLDR